MAKTDYTPYIIGGVILAGGIFLYARKSAKDKANQAAAEAEAERKRLAEEQAAAVKKNVQTSPTYTPYQLQVVALQTKIGVGVDGNPGVGPDSNTNKKVAEWFPSLYKQYGNVSPANVTVYLGAKREEAKKGPSGPNNRLKDIWAAMKAKGSAKFIKDARVSAYYYDSAQKSYIPTGGGFNVKQGETVYFSGATLVGAGIVRVLPTYSSSGKPAGNKLVLIKPEMIYVP